MEPATLDLWDWAKLGFGLLFIVCYVVASIQEWRGAAPEDRDWTQPASNLGLILLVLATAVPLDENSSDAVAFTGAVLVLVAMLVRWRSNDTGAAGRSAT